MMTDREMLELAAKAVGIPIVFGSIYQVGDELIDCSDAAYVKSDQPDVSDEPWNPLEDDADAFRLAAKLGIDVVWNKTRRSYYEEDLLTVRRAIVKAAAKLGEQQNA